MSAAKHLTFYKNLFWQYGLQILKYLFPLLLVPYLTRVLGTSGYAVYAYVLSFMGVVQTVADFGFTLSGTKKVIAYRDSKKQLSQLVGNITLARMILICLLSLLVMAISLFIPIMSENLLYVFLAFVAVALRAMLPDFVFQGYEQMGTLTTRYFASKGVMVLLTILLVHSKSDLLFVAIADIAGGCVGLAWSFVAMKNSYDIVVSRPHFFESLIELKESAIYCVSNVSSSLFSGFTTLIIGLAITSKTDIAFWSLTLTTVNAVQSLYTPISNSLYPHMLNNQDFSFAKKLACLALPVLIVGTAAYCFLSEPIMILLGGREYIGGARVMCEIAPIFPFSFYAILIGWPVLGAMGRVRDLTVSTIFTGIVNVASLSILYLCGAATIDSICIVRWAMDALLMLSRAFALYRVLSSSKQLSVNHYQPKHRRI